MDYTNIKLWQWHLGGIKNQPYIDIKMDNINISNAPSMGQTLYVPVARNGQL